jgi:hypothetical protein
MRGSDFLKFSCLVLGLAPWLGRQVRGDSAISMHFVAAPGEGGDPGHLLAPGDTAGVVAASNWNNVLTTAPYTSSASNLVDNTGLATGANVVATALNTWSYGPNPYTNPNAIMMSSYLDGGSGFIPGVNAVVDVTDVPYKTYEVIVYFSDSGGDPNGTTGVYTLTDGNGASKTFFGWDTAQFAGTFIQSTGTYSGDPNSNGNYMIFYGISTSDFSLVASADPSLGGNLRAPVDSIQIVQLPEPTSVVLLLAGCVAPIARLVGKRRNDD